MASGGMINSYKTTFHDHPLKYALSCHGCFVQYCPRNRKRRTKSRNAEELLFVSLVNKGFKHEHTMTHVIWVDISCCRNVANMDGHFGTAWVHTDSLKCTCAGTYNLGSSSCDDFLWVFLTNDVFTNWPQKHFTTQVGGEKKELCSPSN
jgi:hypothetical protein